MGKGSQQQAPTPSSQTVTQTAIPEYARPYVEQMLGQAQALTETPYQTYGGQRIAEFSPLTQQAYQQVAGLQTPEQYAAATQAAQQAVQGALGTQYTPTDFGTQFQAPGSYQAGDFASQYQAPSAYQGGSFGVSNVSAPSLQQYQMAGPQNVSSQNVNAAQMRTAQTAFTPSLQQYQMGPAQQVSSMSLGTPTMQAAQAAYRPDLQTYQMGPAERVSTGAFTQPGTAEAYMSPYVQQALAPQLAEIQRQSDIAQQGLKAQAVSSGAFGGSRQALQAAEQARNAQTLMSQATGQGYQSAYDRAMQQYSTDAARQMAAQQANQAAGLTVGQQNLAAQLGVQQLGTQTGAQMALANLSAAQQANVQNQAAALQAQGLNAQQALQAALANQQAGLTVGQQNLASKLGVQQLGTQTNLQTALANLSSEQQANVQNQAAQMQAAGMNQQSALQAALANQQAGLTAGQANLQAQLGVQALGAGQSMQAQLANQQAGLTAQQLAEQSRQYGYGQQMSAAQQAAQYGLAAQQAAEQSRQYGYGQDMNAAQLAAQYGLAAQQAAEQSRQYGAGLGLQGLGLGLQGAGQLANIGGAQLGATQNILGMQQQVGAAQQAQAQQAMDMAYQDFLKQRNYPYQQLGFMSDMLRGLPMSQSAQQMYTAPPSIMSQLGGLGMAGLGAYGAMGGFKGAKGGVISAKEGGLMGVKYSVGGNIDSMTKEQLEKLLQSPNITPLEHAQIESRLMLIRRMEANPESSKILSEASIPEAQSMPQGGGLASVPTGNMVPQGYDMAGGGIVAFAQGDVVKTSPFQRDVEDWRKAQLESITSQTPGMLNAYNQPLLDPTADEVSRLRQSIEQQYGPGASIVQGYFTKQTEEERAKAKDIMKRLPRMGLDELRATAGVAPVQGLPTPQPSAPVAQNAPMTGADLRATDPYEQILRSRLTTVPQEESLRLAGIKPTEEPEAKPSGKKLETAFTPPEANVEKYKAQAKSILADIPKDTTFDDIRKEVEEGRAQSKEELGQKMWMRVIEAGLGAAAGTSQYGITNMANGMLQGIKGYGEDLKEQGKLDREDRKLLMDIKKLEHAEKRDDAFKTASLTWQIFHDANEDARAAMRDKTTMAVAQLHYGTQAEQNRAFRESEADKNRLLRATTLANVAGNRVRTNLSKQAENPTSDIYKIIKKNPNYIEQQAAEAEDRIYTQLGITPVGMPSGSPVTIPQGVQVRKVGS